MSDGFCLGDGNIGFALIAIRFGCKNRLGKVLFEDRSKGWNSIGFCPKGMIENDGGYQDNSKVNN